MRVGREYLRSFVYNQERPGDTADILRQGRHWGKWLLKSDYRRKYREISRLTSLPRYAPAGSSLLGTPMELVDAYSFLGMYREIFEQEIYAFRTDNPRPYIIDGGANIGVSVIYFKRHYPQSEILAFEPDEAVFRALETNVRRAGYEDVQLHQRALWSSETQLTFLCEGSDGGRVATSGDEREKRYNPMRAQEWSPGPVVQTTRLCTLLERHVDFLKLDLEGAETEVLQDCSDRLRNVDNVFVEYHSMATEPQTLATVVKLLVDAGFRLQIHQVTPTSPRPFVTRYLRWGMDMQLSIFGTRACHDTRDHAVIAQRYRRHEA